MAPKIAIITLAIGKDYRSALERALNSKREYATKHGYDYFEFHEERWNRERPIAWSKVPIWIEFSRKAEYDFIWISDADVLITNMDKRLEDWVLPLLPHNKNLLIGWDSCGTPNSGNMILRTGSWAVDFFSRVWEQTQFLYHIWWEQMGIYHLMQTNKEDADNIEITQESYRFNAFLKGNPGTRLWEKGDFLVHFAGVYDLKMMGHLMDLIQSGQVPRISMENRLL